MATTRFRMRTFLFALNKQKEAKGIHVDLQVTDLLQFVEENQLEQAIERRGALNGFELIDPSKGWIKTNLRFNHRFKVRNRYDNKPRKPKSEPVIKPINESRMTVAEWILVLRADQKHQKDRLLEVNSE
jgi:hypothetical protein